MGSKGTFAMLLVTQAALSLACGGATSGDDGGLSNDGGVGGGSGGSGAGGGNGGGAGGGAGGAGGGSGGSGGGGATAVCSTRITYGSAWLRPSNHPADDDVAAENVTWDGACAVDGSGNSFATLSNGWKPYFAGRGGCVIALDHSAACAPAPGSCATRESYGASWSPAPGHPDFFDDVPAAVSWDGVCHPAGAQSWAGLSNGWTPYFNGGACDLSFRYGECGGLFANPVVAADCPDPGVVLVGKTYVMACTSGNAASPFPLRTSTDLVHWTERGTLFTAATKPTWATGDFWAPEIHRVGGTWVAYFSARHTGGDLAIGAATAANVLGPYTDLGAPLLRDPNPGVIDVHQFTASSGQPYLLWKVDGNSGGLSTPIKIQPLAASGTVLTGAATTLISDTLSWEGPLVEGPWMIERAGFFYLFYSGNFYASASYAVGVARASAPTGPFVKANAPLLVSKGAWAGPGHGSVVVGPSGDWVHVFHSWVAGKLQQAPGRQVLVERIGWANGWPTMLGGPSSRSQPMP